MKISVFASGSSGNCLLIEGESTNILIDAGISTRRISAFLAGRGLKMEDIGGVLITHEHSDHIFGLKTLIKNYDTAIYAPHTVANRMAGFLPGIEQQLKIIPVGTSFRINGMTINAFHTPHDTDESVGYRVEENGVFGLATDMGHVTDEIRDGLCGADAVLIESNHDEDMLRYGPYPVYLKRRILSEHGHLSNPECARFARFLVENGTRDIVLGHLSRENNTPRMALSCTEAETADLGGRIHVAPVLGCLTVDVETENQCLV